MLKSGEFSKGGKNKIKIKIRLLKTLKNIDFSPFENIFSQVAKI
jgi:hypothetical protein